MNIKKKNRSNAILIAALFLGLAAPFGIFYCLQNGLEMWAAVCFGLLSASMGLIAWKG